MTDTEDEAKYVGCFSSDTFFGDKVYEGGSTGANFNLALYNAKLKRKKYFAIAKAGSDGHAFSFSNLINGAQGTSGNMKGQGCERPCDDVPEKVCGCSDLACTGPVPKGEEHNRRWAVYEIISSN